MRNHHYQQYNKNKIETPLYLHPAQILSSLSMLRDLMDIGGGIFYCIGFGAGGIVAPIFFSWIIE